ncbi:MAG: hypothetical protein WBD74_01380 [Candidatus Aquilonibacter sp.]
MGTHLDAHTATTLHAPWPAAAANAPDAPPRILALWINSAAITPGSQWFGRIATTTNVASVEIRTESFSFNATRVAFGQFVFLQHVLDIVPQYKRPYTLQVIARNAAGTEDARLIPITLH